MQSVRKRLKTVGITEESPELSLLIDNGGSKKKRNKRAKRDDISVDDVLKEFFRMKIHLPVVMKHTMKF
jgi:hypothetical protein